MARMKKNSRRKKQRGILFSGADGAGEAIDQAVRNVLTDGAYSTVKLKPVLFIATFWKSVEGEGWNIFRSRKALIEWLAEPNGATGITVYSVTGEYEFNRKVSLKKKRVK